MSTVLINGTAVAMPPGAIAYKYADPTEDARWVFESEDAAEIAAVDPSLLAYPAETKRGGSSPPAA